MKAETTLKIYYIQIKSNKGKAIRRTTAKQTS